MTYSRDPNVATNSSQSKRATLLRSFPAEMRVFEDHFPGTPIVPAFVQLMEVRRAVGAWLGVSVREAQIKRVKFLQPIQPEQMVELNLEQRSLGEVISFSLDISGRVLTQGEIVVVA